jgi:hypothetical protein
LIDSFPVWWLIGWAYDYFVSRMDSERRKEFDERLEYLLTYEEAKRKEKQDRVAMVKAMQENAE